MKKYKVFYASLYVLGGYYSSMRSTVNINTLIFKRIRATNDRCFTVEGTPNF